MDNELWHEFISFAGEEEDDEVMLELWGILGQALGVNPRLAPTLPPQLIFLLQLIIFIRDLSFGILFIRKLHQIHFVFLLIILGY